MLKTSSLNVAKLEELIAALIHIDKYHVALNLSQVSPDTHGSMTVKLGYEKYDSTSIYPYNGPVVNLIGMAMAAHGTSGNARSRSITAIRERVEKMYYDDRIPHAGSYYAAVKRLYGLSDEQAEALFLVDPEMRDRYKNSTPEEVVKVLRHLIATDTVVWHVTEE